MPVGRRIVRAVPNKCRLKNAWINKYILMSMWLSEASDESAHCWMTKPARGSSALFNAARDGVHCVGSSP